MLKWPLSKPWILYLTLQALGLFHEFYPLPYHYRHHLGRWLAMPLAPGILLAFVLDWEMRGRAFVQSLLDNFFIAFVTLLINCALFALILAVVRWSIHARQNSWRSNHYVGKDPL